MSTETFRRTLAFLRSIALEKHLRLNITMGGGEPTIHPNFLEFLMMLEARQKRLKQISKIEVITNGKYRPAVMELLRRAAGNTHIRAGISRDPWHEPIDPEMIELWKKESLKHENIHFRTDGIIRLNNRGRAETMENIERIEACSSNELFITPEGHLFACSCKKHSFGTVFTPRIPEEYYKRENKCSETAMWVDRTLCNESKMADLFIMEKFVKDEFERDKKKYGRHVAKERARANFRAARAKFDEVTGYKYAYKKPA